MWLKKWLKISNEKHGSLMPIRNTVLQKSGLNKAQKHYNRKGNKMKVKMSWKDIEDFAVSGIVILTCMAIGWAVCVVGLGLLGVL